MNKITKSALLVQSWKYGHERAKHYPTLHDVRREAAKISPAFFGTRKRLRLFMKPSILLEMLREAKAGYMERFHGK